MPSQPTESVQLIAGQQWEEINSRGLADKVYLWSDDNLSSDYFWRYLTDSDLTLIQSYRNYGKVACFKGIDAESFAFNTGADPVMFEQQFDLFRRLLALKIDLFAYVTFTTSNPEDLVARVQSFVDRLQQLDSMLPLRTVPLEVLPFTPVQGRLDTQHRLAMETQYAVLEAWRGELQRRFTADLRGKSICEIRLNMK